ncbi:MAG: HlyD family efflux transporter periplasmic adaptor subunit [Phycisphaerae bacterium]|nr:HlyD family efflux transporter periplasmic adaptor subunit [Phycisphaerae bacterium]
MKKWLVLLIIAALVGTLYYVVVSFVEYTPGWLKGEKVTIKRGNIRSPVSASGRVEPAEKIDIKSEASGAVTHILIEEGDFVRQGDTLVILDPNDETRSVEIAQLQLQDAQTNYVIAVETHKRAKDVGIPQAKASLAGARAECKQAELNHEKLSAVDSTARTNLEVPFAAASLDAAKARVASAEASVRAAQVDATLAEQRADLAKKGVETAQKNLGDAEERLAETVIKAPQDGMIAKLMVQVGTLVQSGTKSLTGGTMLLRLADTSRLYVIAMVDDADFGLVRRIAPESARPQMRPGDGKPRGRKATAAAAATQPQSDAAATTQQAIPADPTKRVKVLVDTFPDEEFWGVIERIDPEGDAVGAMVQYKVHVRLVSDNCFDLLQLGLPAQVEFTAESRQDVLMIESRCIRKEDEQYGVFVPDPTPQDKLNTRFVHVRTGITDGTYTEILPGSELKEGQEVYLVPPRPARERGKE